MVSKEIAQKIRHIEIYTRRLLSGALVGDNRSAVKGSGFEFDQIRDYQMGDDIRFIDWHSSARMNTMLVKQYVEERNRTIVLAVDVSASRSFSSTHALRSELIAEIASVLALVGDYGKDSVGLLLFSQDVELFIPPATGRKQARIIMEKLFTYQATRATTSIKSALTYLAALQRRDAVVFLISDFIDDGFEPLLRVVAKKHDLIALRCLDAHEQTFPDVGFITVQDSETGSECLLDTRRAGAGALSGFLHKRMVDQSTLFRRCGVDAMDITIGKPFVGDLIRFFRRRMRY
jgi:uncharacterized protein (DUF58 family)